MSMFKPAVKEVGFVKGGIYGPRGTGKTTLLAMILIYLSKTYHKNAPVAWLASEKGVDFVIDMFAAEKVPLLLLRTRSFPDLRKASREALSEGACGIGVDSVTHFWQELFAAAKKSGGAPLQYIGKAKEEWAPFAQDFQDSAIHYLVSGRMGYDWEDGEIEDANGNIVKEISKNGTKMKAEGDFGHEPDLEIQMSQIEDPDFVRFEKIRGRTRKTFKSQMLHVATVKKCRVWSLNGKAFSWKDVPAYKPGYYQAVAESFLPYFQYINIGGHHHVEDMDRPKSEALFQRGSSDSVVQDSIIRKGFIEEIDNLLNCCFPGGEKLSKIHAMFRNLTLEYLNGFTSWSRMEDEVSTIQLRRNVEILQKLRERINAGERVADQASLSGILHLSTQDVEKPGHGVTLLELMTAKSMDRAKKPITPSLDEWPKRGPQPAVALMDAAENELGAD